MQYLLTEQELADARNFLADQLRDQTTVAAVKGLVVDGLREAIMETLPLSQREAFYKLAAEKTRRHWEKFPPGPVRDYFEHPGFGDPE
jgi:hypothetical protein